MSVDSIPQALQLSFSAMRRRFVLISSGILKQDRRDFGYLIVQRSSKDAPKQICVHNAIGACHVCNDQLDLDLGTLHIANNEIGAVFLKSLA
jgi:hypothetical protein